jgi:hypothetical protein
LEPNEKARLAELMTEAFDTYGREFNPSTVDLYLRLFSAHPFPVIEQAFLDHYTDPDAGKFFPLPADLVRQIKAREAEAAAADLTRRLQEREEKAAALREKERRQDAINAIAARERAKVRAEEDERAAAEARKKVTEQRKERMAKIGGPLDRITEEMTEEEWVAIYRPAARQWVERLS